MHSDGDVDMDAWHEGSDCEHDHECHTKNMATDGDADSRPGYNEHRGRGRDENGSEDLAGHKNPNGVETVLSLGV